MHDEFATCGRVHLPGSARCGERESGESGEGDIYDRYVALPPSEDSGRWRKMGGEGNIYAGLTFARDALFLHRRAGRARAELGC